MKTTEILSTYPFSFLPTVVRDLMTDGLFKKTVLPVFGSNRFPIRFYTNATPTEEQIVLESLILIRANLTQEQCEQWNTALYRESGVSVPHNLEGRCVKKEPNPHNVKCQATPDKWSCSGCGLSWIPGSYMSKSCKSHPDPKWRTLLQSDLDALITEHGVSKEAPIIWVNGVGERRFKSKT